MYLQNSAFRDLCTNYTLPLILMLLGAWFLGVLLSWLWNNYKRRALENEVFNLRAELDNTRFKLNGKHGELNDLAFAKQQLDKEHALLRGDYNKLHQKLLVVNNPNPVLPPAPEPEISDFQEEEEVIPEHVQEVTTSEPFDNEPPPNENQESDEPIIEDAEVEEPQGEEDPFDGIFEEDIADESISDEEEVDSFPTTDLPKNNPTPVPIERNKLYFNKIFTSFEMIPNNELKAVKGIGRKIEKLLWDNRITSLEQIGKMQEEEIKNLLALNGENHESHHALSWPDQAGLILTGNWTELIQFQKIIERGEKGYIEGQPVKIERVLSKVMGYPEEYTDLKIIEGIGPKIEYLLKEAGYLNWSHLAKAEIENLKQLLEAAGKNYQVYNPSSWPTQARMALANDWKGLRKMQKELIT